MQKVKLHDELDKVKGILKPAKARQTPQKSKNVFATEHSDKESDADEIIKSDSDHGKISETEPQFQGKHKSGVQPKSRDLNVGLWSPPELRVFIQLAKKHGRDWKTISDGLRTRSMTACAKKGSEIIE